MFTPAPLRDAQRDRASQTAKKRGDGMDPHRENWPPASSRHRAGAQREVGIREGGNATLAVAIRRTGFKPTFPHHPPEVRRNDPKSRLWA